MACNFVKRKLAVIVIISGEFDTERLSSVYSADCTVEGHRPKDGRELPNDVARLWLATHDTDFYQQGTEKLVLLYDTFLSYGGDYVEM